MRWTRLQEKGIGCFDRDNIQVGYVIWSPLQQNWIWHAWPKGPEPIYSGRSYDSAKQGREPTEERAKAQVIATLALNGV
jgi:hypothetical protein